MFYGANMHSDAKTAINRKRAVRRRELARTITDIRSRIGQTGSLHNDFELERQHLFADNRISSAYAVPMLAMIVAAISNLWIDPYIVVIWLIFTLSLHFLTVGTCRSYERQSTSKRSVQHWLRRFVIGDLLYACSWAAFFLLPLKEGAGGGFQVFQFATMLIVVAMNTMLSATLPKALLAGTLPVSLTVTLTLLQQKEPIHYTLAAMAVGAQGFFFILGSQLLKTANTMLEYRAEKDHLIAELETANALSDESRRRAEEANLAKSRFLATMSHELRTPLNAILGFSEVMKDEILGPMHNANYRAYAADIHASGDHLLNLINEILDLSRIEAGRHQLQEEALSLTGVLDECCSMMRIRANAKSINLTASHPDIMPRVWGDERALRQVILNLLSNAVKFTPAGGTVEASMGGTRDGGLFVSVKDNGPGIPEEEIPVVLQAFGQGAVAIQSAEPGTGLGLSIVQALVGMHGGTFELKSRLREGTEAIVTLPASRVLEPMPVYEQPVIRRHASARKIA